MISANQANNKLTEVLVTEELERIDHLVEIAIERGNSFFYWNRANLSDTVYAEVANKLIDLGYRLSNTGNNPIRVSF